MEKWGKLLDALAKGTTQPYTKQQSQFVEVTKGRRDSERDVEHAWVDYCRALAMARC